MSLMFVVSVVQYVWRPLSGPRVHKGRQEMTLGTNTYYSVFVWPKGQLHSWKQGITLSKPRMYVRGCSQAAPSSTRGSKPVTWLGRHMGAISHHEACKTTKLSILPTVMAADTLKLWNSQTHHSSNPNNLDDLITSSQQLLAYSHQHSISHLLCQISLIYAISHKLSPSLANSRANSHHLSQRSVMFVYKLNFWIIFESVPHIVGQSFLVLPFPARQHVMTFTDVSTTINIFFLWLTALWLTK